MATVFTFVVTQLEMAPSLDGLTDVVTRVRYNYTGVDEIGTSYTFAGATPMPLPSGTDFIPLENLTEAEVVAWLEVVSDKTHMQEVIEKNIYLINNPKFVDTPLPWAPAPEPVPEATSEEII